MYKYHPILFKPVMVNAIFKLLKWQTRRTRGLEIINENPDDWQFEWADFGLEKPWRFTQKSSINETSLKNHDFIQEALKCPFGKPGDILWVREMFYAYGYWGIKGSTKSGKNAWQFFDATAPDLKTADFTYHYSNNPPPRLRKNNDHDMGWYKRNSLFMPKHACRLFLKIESIRPERLQDISEEDARAEGVDHVIDKITGYCGYDYINGGYNLMTTAYKSFRSLWRKINGQASWDKNPWVWCIKFTITEKPADFK